MLHHVKVLQLKQWCVPPTFLRQVPIALGLILTLVPIATGRKNLPVRFPQEIMFCSPVPFERTEIYGIVFDMHLVALATTVLATAVPRSANRFSEQ